MNKIHQIFFFSFLNVFLRMKWYYHLGDKLNNPIIDQIQIIVPISFNFIIHKFFLILCSLKKFTKTYSKSFSILVFIKAKSKNYLC